MFLRGAKSTLAAAVILSLTGCASIVSKSQWPVTIQSKPAGAKCVVAKADGVAIHTGDAPMTVTLASSKGFFSAAEYKINCQKEGYQPTEAKLEGSISGWYLGGNLLFGGLIGYLIVDPATGAMWKLEDNLTVTMAQLATAAEPAQQPALTKAADLAQQPAAVH